MSNLQCIYPTVWIVISMADYPGPYLMSCLWGVTGVDEIMALMVTCTRVGGVSLTERFYRP
jgi:hypothetical protein